MFQDIMHFEDRDEEGRRGFLLRIEEFSTSAGSYNLIEKQLCNQLSRVITRETLSSLLIEDIITLLEEHRRGNFSYSQWDNLSQQVKVQSSKFMPTLIGFIGFSTLILDFAVLASLSYGMFPIVLLVLAIALLMGSAAVGLYTITKSCVFFSQCNENKGLYNKMNNFSENIAAEKGVELSDVTTPRVVSPRLSYGSC